MVKPSRTHREQLLARNSRVDRGVVTAYRKLRGELKQLGVEKKAQYSLEPPLGRKPTACHNRTRPHSAPLSRESRP